MTFDTTRRFALASGAALAAATVLPAWAQAKPLRFAAVFSDKDIRAEMMQRCATDVEPEVKVEPFLDSRLCERGTERVALDGATALAIYEEFDPSVVLLDIGMPDMDGYEVARRIRAGFPERATAIVALTGWGQDQDRWRTRLAGFDHHLTKPADIAGLQALLQEVRR